MSNERKNRGDDPLVADTYKALAKERVPDHLNRRMLRMAAREGRTPYSRARAWMRPAAWAATVLLSFAIVLELTRLPQIEPDPAIVAMPEQELADSFDGVGKQARPAAESADRVTRDTFAPKDMAVLRDAESRARAQAGPKPAPITSRADIDGAANEAVAVKSVSVDEDIPAGSGVAEHDAAERPSSERSSAEGRLAEPVSAAASFAVADKKEALESGFACPKTMRESAESWLACIAQLRESGQEELADSEYDEFQRAFPDFANTEADR